MRVLVTGATGFLGRSVCRILRRDHEVIALGSHDADLTRQDALRSFDDTPVERIYHLAAWTQPGDFAKLHKGEQFLANQQIDLTVLTWWMRRQPQAKLVSIGTSAAYAPDEEPREENYLKGAPVDDLYFYAMAKRFLFMGQLALQQQFGMKHLTAVPSALYGPGYAVLTKRMNFVLDIAWKVLKHKHAGTPIVLWGDGTQVREAVYVDDFVAAMLAIDERVENEIVNIGAGGGHTIAEFASAICEIAGVDPSAIQYDVSRHVGARSKLLDNDKLDALLPDRSFTPLREGLAMIVRDLEPIVIGGK